MAETEGSPFGGFLEKLKNYGRTQRGTILAAEILLSLIVVICFAASWYGGLIMIALCEMIFAIIFFVIYMFELDKQFMVVHWPWSDLFRAMIGAALYIIISPICLFRVAGDGAGIAGGVFGLLAGILFAYDSYTLCIYLKSTRQQTAAPTV